MSFYSYDVSVNTSTLSTDVALPDRGVNSADASLNPDAPSSDIVVDTNINWINSASDQDIDLPTGSERFIFDMNNPSCWPGTGATIFDLSGNGYNCEHAQLGLLYDDPLADTSTHPYLTCSYPNQTGYSLDSDSTVLDYIETGQNAEGRVYLHINPDIENENVKYIRYPAPGTAPEGGKYTFFMVGEAVQVDDFEPSEEINPSEPLIDEDPNGDFTILGRAVGNVIQTRGSDPGGFSFSGPYGVANASFNLMPYYGIPAIAFGRSYEYGHTKYGYQGFFVKTPRRYFFSNTEYEDQYRPLYESFTNENYESTLQVDQVDNYSPGSAYQYTRFDYTGLQVFSITYDGDKARTYINGKFVGEMDMNPNTGSSTSPYWTMGASQNGNTTMRACSARENKFYAWGFYDRTLTTEEHLQIHRKYLRHPNPIKSVAVNNIPGYALFNVISNSGRPDVDVKMDSDPSATKSHDISLDLSSASADVSVTPLPDLSL